MPTYDYVCAACGHRFEVVHGVHADGPTTCPLCGGGPVRKAFAPPTIHFKGSGWAKKDRRATGPRSATAESGGDGLEGEPSTAGRRRARRRTPSGGRRRSSPRRRASGGDAADELVEGGEPARGSHGEDD